MQQSTIGTALFVGILVLASLYGQGLGGMFFIDDVVVFEGMLAVKDWHSAIDYIFSGESGPLGRPVALATFLLHQSAYPENTTPFLLVNIFIHLANVLLVAAVVYQLQRRLPDLMGSSPWLAPAVALLWGGLPILASTSMMTVQRMTSLSALFSLLGILAYLWARTEVFRQHWLKLCLAIVVLGVCVVLSMCSKESGALLPLLLLVLHSTLFATKNQRNHYGRLLAAALWLPSLLVLGYLAYRIPYLDAGYALRPFTLLQRLASESVILWQYLRVAFLPGFMDLSPFQDDYPVRQFSDTVVQLALCAWVAVLAVALVLWRRGNPLLLFAVLWYLAGHLLESTVIPLFLYFEHRNYLPLVGPVLALAVGFQRIPLAIQLKGLMVVPYGLFLLFILWQATSTWGDRRQLVWAKANPDSLRALQLQAGAYMRVGRVQEVDALYETAINRNPQYVSVVMQGVRASCYGNDKTVAEKWLRYAEKLLPSGDFSYLTIPSLEAITGLLVNGNCNTLTGEEVIRLADLLAENPLYTRGPDWGRLVAVRANIYLSRKDTVSAINEMQSAIKRWPDIETVAVLYHLLLSTYGEQRAAEFLAEVRENGPPAVSARKVKEWYQNISDLASMRETTKGVR